MDTPASSVPRTLILQSISDSPAPLNQCPV
ncbi:hypothetical protein AYI70_g1349, partial [Smittium culicis]